MRTAGLWLGVLLTATALSGCSSGDNEPDDDGILPTVTTTRTSTSPGGGIRTTSTTTSSPPGAPSFWYDSFPVSDETYVSHLWRVPQGAAQDGVVTLDIAPLRTAEQGVVEWVFFAFEIDEEAETARLAASAFGAPLQVRGHATPALPDGSVLATNTTPQRIVLPASIGDGDLMGLVVGGAGPDLPLFGLAFRIATDPVPDTLQKFALLIAGKPGQLLAPLASGSDFQVGFYADVNEGILAVPPGIAGLEVWTDAVDVVDTLPVDTRPLITARILTLSSEFASDKGWGFGAAAHVGFLGADIWGASATVHGQPLTNTAITAHAVVASTAPLLGTPFYAIEGSGDGGTTTQLQLVIANVNLFEALTFVQYDLDRPLFELFGYEGVNWAVFDATPLP